MQLPLRSVCWWLLHMCRWARLIFRIVDSCMASITAIAIQSIQNNSIISQQKFFYTILPRISTHKWNNVLCNCTVVTTVTVIRKMMYCDVTSGLCTYISCVLVDVFITFESWPVCNIKYRSVRSGGKATMTVQSKPPSPFPFNWPDKWQRWRRKFEQFRKASGLSTES